MLARFNFILPLLLLLEELVVVLVYFVADASQLQRLDADYLVFGSTLFTSDHVAFFHFVHFDIQIIFAFWAGGHGGLLSLMRLFHVSRFGMTIPCGPTP